MEGIGNVRVGDHVESLIDQYGGSYEPHCVLRKGDVVKVTEVHRDHIVCDPYCGFTLRMGEFSVIPEPTERAPMRVVKVKRLATPLAKPVTVLTHEI